jgi:hypothetical protein
MNILHWLLRGFVPLWHLVSRYPLIFLPLVVFFAIHWDLVLGGFDAAHVIWSDSPRDCILAGLGIGIVLGAVMTATWWLDVTVLRHKDRTLPKPNSGPYVAGWLFLCILALAPAVFRGELFEGLASPADAQGKPATPDNLDAKFVVCGTHLSRVYLPVGLVIAMAVGLGGYGYSRWRGLGPIWLWWLGWGPPIVVAGGYVVLSVIHWFSPSFYIPWMAASLTGVLMLGLVITCGAGLHRFGCSRHAGAAFYPVMIGFILLFVVFGGWIEPVHQVPGLEKYYAMEIAKRPSLDFDPLQYRVRFPVPDDGPLVSDKDALEAWHKLPLNQHGPVIVLSVSGGASTSAVFVARSLFRLEKRFPGFSEQVRVICGASGGMLGASYFVSQFRPGSPYRWDVRSKGFAWWRENLAQGKAKEDKEPSVKEFADAYQRYLTRLEQGKGNDKNAAPLDEERAYWEGMQLMEDKFIAALENDFLKPLYQKWVHKDLNPIGRFFPHETQNDRGSALELAWDRHLLGRPVKPADGKIPVGQISWDATLPCLGVPFDELRQEEQQGLIPSLVFTPMLIEDGRQLIISNLDLGYMIDAGSYTSPKDPKTLDAQHGPQRTISAIEFYRLFPDAVGQFRLGTAVRLNATFPVFTPATELPTNPPRRVVDAGYYDNYGLIVASRWISANREWLETNDIPVWVIEKWAYGYDEQSRFLVSAEEKQMLDAHPDRLAVPNHAFRSSSLPVGALFTAWDTSMAYRGEERLNSLIYEMNFARFNAEPPKDPIAYRYRMDIGKVALPMNWVLTSQSLARLKTVSQDNLELFDAVGEEWHRHKGETSVVKAVEERAPYKHLPPAAKARVRDKVDFGARMYDIKRPNVKLPAP